MNYFPFQRAARHGAAWALPLLLASACDDSHVIREDAVPIHPVLETAPVSSTGDAADDPAIWIHPLDPLGSLVLGTDKKRGLAVYDLDGNEVQFLERGRLNNVDLRAGVNLNGAAATLAVATNRSAISMDIFSISPQGQVRFIDEVPLTLSDPYGICMGLDETGQAHAFVNSTDAEYQHWLLNPGGALAPRLEGSWRLASGPEGCAVDDAAWTLYMGEEEHGVWMMPATASRAAEKVLLEGISAGHLAADVEGMDVYRRPDGQAYLLVSSQGDNSFAVYDLNRGNAYRGSFRLAATADGGIDGVQETDGLAVTPIPLGSLFPRGMLAVQDGYNELPDENQNFKLASWADVERALELE